MRTVCLPCGKEAKICGMPIGQSDEQLRERFPALMASIDSGDAGAMAAAIIRMGGNQHIADADLWVDEYTYQEIERIFFGSIYDRVKKKASDPCNDTSGQPTESGGATMSQKG